MNVGWCNDWLEGCLNEHRYGNDRCLIFFLHRLRETLSLMYCVSDEMSSVLPLSCSRIVKRWSLEAAECFISTCIPEKQTSNVGDNAIVVQEQKISRSAP